MQASVIDWGFLVYGFLIARLVGLISLSSGAVVDYAMGGTVYLTTLLGASEYPEKELAELHKERWKVELDFRALKTDLNMDMLRCKSPEMAEKEITVKFMAYNLIRSNIVAASSKHGTVARKISFKSAVQIIDAALLRFSSSSLRVRKNGYEIL